MPIPVYRDLCRAYMVRVAREVGA